ncbi:expressed protein [Phakopsora pachyrhizi]|uniref:Expressed protein n=1 Tax=Phakopsora pachyrhizi TaxID=170000 RepID=A0AAV0BC92_PHAPC|nr:expressed protein [Phakopsora pachyrhizi]
MNLFATHQHLDILSRPESKICSSTSESSLDGVLIDHDVSFGIFDRSILLIDHQPIQGRFFNISSEIDEEMFQSLFYPSYPITTTAQQSHQILPYQHHCGWTLFILTVFQQVPFNVQRMISSGGTTKTTGLYQEPNSQPNLQNESINLFRRLFKSHL